MHPAIPECRQREACCLPHAGRGGMQGCRDAAGMVASSAQFLSIDNKIRLKGSGKRRQCGAVPSCIQNKQHAACRVASKEAIPVPEQQRMQATEKCKKRFRQQRMPAAGSAISAATSKKKDLKRKKKWFIYLINIYHQKNL